ncbi:hypothetical protein [Faecalimicrobium dakarense]|uniref:hypothetical protein n=1 Tax=Faecalimicrobium dakarense TaxID=1301100 RepID=UPI0004ADA38A|nr:hypothetical protein [[Clostridium] dakarense]
MDNNWNKLHALLTFNRVPFATFKKNENYVFEIGNNTIKFNDNTFIMNRFYCKDFNELYDSVDCMIRG